jgi:hypothetical protein
MINSLLLFVVLSATPQEHQLNAVLDPKEVTVKRLNLEVTIKPIKQPGRKVTLIVKDNQEEKLNNVVKNKEKIVKLNFLPNVPYHAYIVPFEDLETADKLKELAKNNNAVQMYPTFSDIPFMINGRVVVNIKLNQLDKLKDFVRQHNLEMEDFSDRPISTLGNNTLGAHFLYINDNSDVLDVFELVKLLESQEWVRHAYLDSPVVPLR